MADTMAVYSDNMTDFSKVAMTAEKLAGDSVVKKGKMWVLLLAVE